MTISFGASSALLLALATVACGTAPTPGDDVATDAASSSDAPDTTDATDDAAACGRAGPTEVAFTTDDGVRLAGDLYTTGTRGAAGVVLLHMVPPANDRANYPRAFIDTLVGRGFAVLNVDRRGAGASGGVARDAYLGPNGWLDARAAVDFLVGHSCAIDPARVAIVGASNGSTTALDYAVHAARDAMIRRPAALVFLTGGTYTEGQYRLADAAVHTALETVAIQFVFSTAERAWSVQQMAAAPASWTFREYDPGDHGTRMFAVQPGAAGDVADFLATRLR
jgi:dipeptidyl aminopeptidase/acylaminoacyl peptidase